MLTESQIQQALRASSVAPVEVSYPHGPLGLDQLAEVVQRGGAARQRGSTEGFVERPLALPVATWEKLDHLARRGAHHGERPTSASAVAAALLEQYLAEVIPS